MSKSLEEILLESDELPQICHDKKQTIEWLRKNQLILLPDQFKCPIDGTLMFQYGDTYNCDGVKFRCIACKQTKTSKFGSFLEQFRLPIRLVVRVLFVCFLRDYPIETAMMEVQTARGTIQRIYSYGMQMIYKWEKGERGGAFQLNVLEEKEEITGRNDFVIELEDQNNTQKKCKKKIGSEGEDVLKAVKNFYKQFPTIQSRLRMFLIILQTLASVKICEQKKGIEAEICNDIVENEEDKIQKKIKE